MKCDNCNCWFCVNGNPILRITDPALLPRKYVVTKYTFTSTGMEKEQFSKSESYDWESIRKDILKMHVPGVSAHVYNGDNAKEIPLPHQP